MAHYHLNFLINTCDAQNANIYISNEIPNRYWAMRQPCKYVRCGVQIDADLRPLLIYNVTLLAV